MPSGSILDEKHFSSILLHYAFDEEGYVSAGDVGVKVDAFVEYPHIFGVVGDRHNSLFASLYGAFGVFYADAAARGCGAGDDERCASRIDEFEKVGDFLALMGEVSEVVIEVFEGNFGSFGLVFCPDYTQECKQEEGEYYNTFHNQGGF